ncbi:prominin-like protein [Lycorma delicatula]|uniref:prominin-like protein n=1 Tax=Lycorma delicatula TaxID=130591 RepID=UPI003F50F5BD
MSSLRPGRTKSPPIFHFMMYFIVLIVIFLVSDVTCVRQKQLNNITRLEGPRLQSSLMPFEQIRYSVANVSNNYKSTTKFHHRGMGHLYFITHQFMNVILRGEAYPEGLLYLDNHNNIRAGDLRAQWRAVITHYSVMLCIAVAAVLFIVIMPIAGLFFCCCRCAGRCGSRSQPFEKRYDPCRRHMIGFLLSGVTILIMFGVVCAFVTNEYLEEGAHNLPHNIRTSIRDTQLYINNTKLEVNNLLIINFAELDSALDTILRESGQIVKEKLGEISKAEVLSNLTSIVTGLSTIRTDLNNIDSLTKQLQDKAMVLELALKDTRERLLEKLNQCRSQQPCLDFLKTYNITHLSLEANFTQLPDVTASLQNVSALLENNIEYEVSKGHEEFEKVKTSIQQSVDRNIPLISQNIKRTGVAIRKGAEKINKVLDKVQSMLSEYTSQPVDMGEAYLKEYGDYRYYVGLGVSSTVLVVLSCLTFGLFCGYCGKRPDGGYNDDCCDKGTGAHFLMLGVWVMFLTSAGLMAVTLVYFVTGVMAEFAVCKPLEDPGDSRIFTLIDEVVKLDKIYNITDGHSPPLNISSVIRSCHNNGSIYKVLRLEQLFDISEVTDYASHYGILERIKELTDNIRLDQHVDILTRNAEQQLLKLADSPLNNIDLIAYTNVLDEKITSIDLIQLSNALHETANKLPQSQINVKNSLRLHAQYLEMHQHNQVHGMLRLSRYLDSNATQLSEHLRFNQSSLREAVYKMLGQIEKAQEFLDTQGPQIVGQLAKDFGEEFVNHLKHYLVRVTSHTEHDVGKCHPLSMVYNATVVAGCSRILDPFNGFWVSVGWILVLFIPAIVFSVKLASLYQKSDPYPGPLVEAEYLYDAYADRDNIPLANVHGKKKKGQRRYRHESYDNTNGAAAPGGAAADYSGHLGRTPADRGGANSGAHGDNRYSDIAPKHWDFPNGGPPRYHQSPPLSTEYERPPPYYYPGPAPTSRN